MGQPSLPLLNKVGYSMHWNSNWSNLVSYKKFLYFDFFVKKFFFFFFDDKVITLFVKKFYLPKKVIITSELLLPKKKISLPLYVTSVWFLYYQNWVVLTLYVYLPRVFLIKKEDSILYKTTYNVSFINFFKKNQKKKIVNKYSF